MKSRPSGGQLGNTEGAGGSTSTAAPTPSGDISMLDPQAQNHNQDQSPVDDDSQPEDSREDEDTEEPDWNLFHALNSTRSALSDLTQQSRTPVVPRDPSAEVRTLEGSTTGMGSTIPPMSSFGGQTPGTGIGTPTPGFLGPVGSRLRTTSHIASSPLAR